VSILDKHQRIEDIRNVTVGLRTVKLVFEEGKTFHFTVNGLPIFAKGSNLVPINYFLPTGYRNTSHYTRIIDDAVRANFNMVRVWGGGHYELDIFYSMCDEAGLMIWQDFMFANTNYPFQDNFLATVKQEITEVVKRLRTHASVVFYCGNNEVF